MPETFAVLFSRHLKGSGLTLREFARRVGRNHGYLSLVSQGKRGPPDRGVEDWGKHLGLNETESDHLVLAAGLARSPERVQKAFAALEGEVARLRTRKSR